MNDVPAVDYKLGGMYAVATAMLLASQAPFSFPVAKHLDTLQFVLLTQSALLLSVPVLIFRANSRRAFFALLRSRGNWPKMVVIFALGISGLFLYNLALKDSHPIVVSALLNLAPFWAAVVAYAVSRVPLAVSALTFIGCLAVAFFGAIMLTWSQLGADAKGFSSAITRGGWYYALPIPLLTTLSGSLINKWFGNSEESAAIAATFLIPAIVLIPILLFALHDRPHFGLAILLFL